MTDYRSMQDRPSEYAGVTDQVADTAKRVSDKAREYGEQALERTEEAAKSARDIMLEHPVATLAIAAGLAFAIGALWKIGSSRPQTGYDRLMARLGDLQSQMPRGWGR